MDQIYMLLASVFAGLCAAAVVLLMAEMVSAIDVEKAQFGEDARQFRCCSASSCRSPRISGGSANRNPSAGR